MRTDEQIWDGIVNGDVNSLKSLHDRYYHQLWLWSKNYINDSSSAEELVSDCFIKLWDHRKQILIERSIKSYLFLMVRNKLISYIRSSKADLQISLDSIPDMPDEETINEQEFYTELYRAIGKIPEQRRKVLELAVFESLSYKEIAARLEISVNTVKTQMGRAYRFLKEELEPTDIILLQCLYASENV